MIVSICQGAISVHFLEGSLPLQVMCRLRSFRLLCLEERRVKGVPQQQAHWAKGVVRMDLIISVVVCLTSLRAFGSWGVLFGGSPFWGAGLKRNRRKTRHILGAGLLETNHVHTANQHGNNGKRQHAARVLHLYPVDFGACWAKITHAKCVLSGSVPIVYFGSRSILLFVHALGRTCCLSFWDVVCMCILLDLAMHFWA